MGGYARAMEVGQSGRFLGTRGTSVPATIMLIQFSRPRAETSVNIAVTSRNLRTSQVPQIAMNSENISKRIPAYKFKSFNYSLTPS